MHGHILGMFSSCYSVDGGIVRIYSKASLMDPRFGPAWIAFAHTFASEGEHDHAVTAYSTCARLFVG